jgi:6-phosphogluconolactonase
MIKTTVDSNDKEILIFKEIDEMSDYAVNKWTEIAENAIKERGFFTVALSGGKTPIDLYRKLADKHTLPWNKTDVFMVDERFVPYESKENNFRMINELLLLHVGIPSKNIHPIITSSASAHDSASKYENTLNTFLKKESYSVPEFDLILLGIGDDGHTASLFPDTPSLKESSCMVIAVSLEDESKKDRITLTFPVINNSRNIIFLASGINKAGVIKEVIEDSNSQLPASMVRPEKGKLIFLLDETAGSLLSKTV